MADAVAGKNHVFQVLFVGDTNSPIVVADPTITIFSFSQLGVKQTLVNTAPMQAVPAEIGRYVYVYPIPEAMRAGDVLHAEMGASDPLSAGTRLLADDLANIVSTGATSVAAGLVARFVKGG